MDPVTAAFNFGMALLQVIEQAQKRDLAILENMNPEQRERYIERVEKREERLEAFFAPLLDLFTKHSPMMGPAKVPTPAKP